MTNAYALTIDLPQPLPIAIETLRAALRRVMARLANGTPGHAVSAT